MADIERFRALKEQIGFDDNSFTVGWLIGALDIIAREDTEAVGMSPADYAVFSLQGLVDALKARQAVHRG